jgi:hypothetical protein
MELGFFCRHVILTPPVWGSIGGGKEEESFTQLIPKS